MLSARALTYFLATLQTGSFTATARRFGVSVPTVSAAMAQIDDVVGSRLFLRTPRRLSPSEAAAGVEPAARAILQGLLTIERPGAALSPLDLRACHELTLTPLIVARFVAVYEAGSIGVAAQGLRITQPQISRQIAALEAVVSARLFDRHRYGMTATAEAEALYALARPLCDLVAGLVARGNRVFAAGVQTTRIGSVPPFHPESRLAGLLADLCARWPAAAPGSHLTIVTDATDALIGGLLGGGLHAVIVETDLIPDECDSRVLLQSALDLVTGPTGGAPDAERVLMTTPLVLQGRSSALRRMVDGWLAARSLRPPHILEVDAMPVIARLITDHGFCSLVPQGAYPLSPVLRRIALPDAPIFSQRLVWRREQARTRAVRRALELAGRVELG